METKDNDCIKNIRKIIETNDVSSLYQPIISLSTGEIIAYEALSRGPKNSEYYSPTKMIECAENNGLIWELEMLFRKKAIEKAVSIPPNKLLFLNVDPNIIKDNNYKRGFTKKHLAKYNIDPKNIVFEITERSAIEDYDTFKKITKNYKDQGYKLAIDDVGSGYSGLKTLIELRPDYLKIDMDLIRDLDKDSYKESIIRALVSIAKETKMSLIAEGVETLGELEKLIKLGVHNAQGFLICKPNEMVISELPEMKNIIMNISSEINNVINVTTNAIKGYFVCSI